MSIFNDEKPKQITYKLSFDNGFDGSSQEIVMKSTYMDGIGFNELMNGFRQFLIALGYSEETARHVTCLSKEDIEQLGYSEDDFGIVNVE